jgi:hypothetical protein
MSESTPPADTSRNAKGSGSEGFAAFYAATALAIAACGMWNAHRLHARAELLADPARAWAQSAVESFASPGLLSRERALGALLSESYEASPALAELPALPIKAASQSAPQHLSAAAIAIQAPRLADHAIETVVFAGDSLANGYAAGASRALAEFKSKAKALDEGKISTGLVSQSYFDWPARAKALCKSKPGAMVFSFGSNDPIDMKIGGAYVRFGSEAWSEAYAARAAAMVEAAHECGARAVWLMLPPMREESMRTKARKISAAQDKACKLADACVRPFEGLGDGLDSSFKERAVVSGKSKLLRAEDGIHMAPEGYYAVAKQALESLGFTSAPKPSSATQSSAPSSGT